MNSKSTWYVLYVRSKHENKVNTLLQENGFESFLPLIKTVREWSDRKKVLFLPLFPSYIFVNLKTQKEFSRALSINGACSYIKFGKEYAKVSEEEINKIRILNSTPGFQNVHTTNRVFEVGEQYVISYGALDGLECEIVRSDHSHKVIVRINSIRQDIIATLSKALVSEQNFRRIA